MRDGIRRRDRRASLMSAGAIVAAMLTIAAIAPNVGAQSPHPWVRPPNHPGAPQFYRGTFADPSVILVGDTYYAYATNTGGSHLPVLRSDGLVNWSPLLSYNRTTAANRAADSANFVPGRPVVIAQRPDSRFDPWINDGLLDYHQGAFLDITGHNHLRTSYWAPGVAKIGNRFVAYSAVPQFNSDHRCIRASVSSTPEGPFRPIGGSNWIQCDHQSRGVAFSPNGSIDPDPFVAPNGTPYLIWKSEGNPNPPFTPTIIWARRLTADGSGFAPGSVRRELIRTVPNTWEGEIIENPSMIHFQGKFYLFYSGNDWRGDNYATGYAVCDSPLGPCSRPMSTPVLSTGNSNFVGPGGADAFIDKNGNLRLAFHHWLDGTQRTAPNRAYRALGVARVFVRPNGELTVNPNAQPPPTPTPRPTGPVPALPNIPSTRPSVAVPAAPPPTSNPPPLSPPSSPRQF